MDRTIKSKKVCSNCGKEFTTKQSLCRHKRNCGTTNLLSCAKCEKQFARLDSLKRHLISCIKAKPRITICDICSKEFRNSWFLRRHLPCKGKLVCKKCNKGFRKQERHEYHTQRCNAVTSVKLFTKMSKDSVAENVANEEKEYRSRNSNKEHVIERDAKIQSEQENVSNKTIETKVYILDENLSFTDEDNAYPCSVDLHEKHVDIVPINEQTEQDESIEYSRNHIVSNVASSIKRIFTTEGIVVEQIQAEVVTLALQDIGLLQLILNNYQRNLSS